MTINSVFDRVKDDRNNKPDETGPPPIIPRTVSLANHQVNLTFETYLNLFILQNQLHFPLPFKPRSNNTCKLKTFAVAMPYKHHENFTDIAGCSQKV